MDDPIGAAHAKQLTNLATVLDPANIRIVEPRHNIIDPYIDNLMQHIHAWVETGDHDARISASNYARQLATILQHPSTT